MVRIWLLAIKIFVWLSPFTGMSESQWDCFFQIISDYGFISIMHFGPLCMKVMSLYFPLLVGTVSWLALWVRMSYILNPVKLFQLRFNWPIWNLTFTTSLHKVFYLFIFNHLSLDTLKSLIYLNTRIYFWELIEVINMAFIYVNI